METQPKKHTLRALVLWYAGTGLILYIVEVVFLHERQWYGVNGDFSLLQIMLQVLARAVAWPVNILFGINGLGFSADGRYASWVYLGISIAFLAVAWWIVRKRMSKSA